MNQRFFQYILAESYALDSAPFVLLKPFTGKVIEVFLTDLKKDIWMIISESGLPEMLNEPSTIPDLRLEIPSVNLIRLFVFKTPSSQLRMQFIGDTMLAMTLQRVARMYQGSLGDWLAKWIGEAPILIAKQSIATVWRQTKQITNRAYAQAQDYLLYETAAFASKQSVHAFNQAVHDLVLDVARLEAKLEVLRCAHSESTRS